MKKILSTLTSCVLLSATVSAIQPQISDAEIIAIFKKNPAVFAQFISNAPKKQFDATLVKALGGEQAMLQFDAEASKLDKNNGSSKMAVWAKRLGISVAVLTGLLALTLIVDGVKGNDWFTLVKLLGLNTKAYASAAGNGIANACSRARAWFSSKDDAATINVKQTADASYKAESAFFAARTNRLKIESDINPKLKIAKLDLAEATADEEISALKTVISNYETTLKNALKNEVTIATTRAAAAQAADKAYLIKQLAAGTSCPRYGKPQTDWSQTRYLESRYNISLVE